MTQLVRPDHWQQKIFIIVILVSFLGIIGIDFVATRYVNKKSLADLTGNVALVVPDQANTMQLEESLLSGRCKTQADSDCGTWSIPKRLDFSRLPHSPTRVYLVSDFDFASQKAFKSASLNFGEAYGEITAWLDGTQLGTTSRDMIFSAKPIPFAGSESLPIPDGALQHGKHRLVVRVDRFEKLPPMYRLTEISIWNSSTLLQIEFANVIGIASSVILAFFFGIYHLVIYFRRRNPAYLGYGAFCVLAALQEFFFFNISGYLGFASDTTWTYRLPLFCVSPINYVFFRLFANEPLILSLGILRGHPTRARFSRLNPFLQLITIISDILIFAVFPVIILISPFLPLPIMAKIIYSFAIPATIAVNIGTYIVMVTWFIRKAGQERMLYTAPIAAAISINQGAILAAIFCAVGMRSFSSAVLAYMCPPVAILIAIALGNQMSIVYDRIRRRATRLLNAAHDSTTLAEHVTATAAELLRSSSEQNKAIQTISSSVESLCAALTQANVQAQQSARTSENIVIKSHGGQDTMRRLSENIHDLESSIRSLDDIIQLNNSIAIRTDIINDIGFKTQMLSFNASIEAAHAGIHGRGFAVLAEEIGKLAESSGQAANDISQVMQNAQNSVSTIVQSVKNAVSHGNEISIEAIESFDDITEQIRAISDNSTEISIAADRHRNHLVELRDAIVHLETAAQINLTQASDMQRTAQNLSRQGDRIREVGSTITQTLAI